MTTSEELPPPGYEPQDASPRLIGLMGLALAVLIVFRHRGNLAGLRRPTGTPLP